MSTIDVQLICNVVLISVHFAVIQIYTYYFIMVYYGILNVVPCAAYPVRPYCLFILSILVCICSSQTPHISLTDPPLLCKPQICSLYLQVCVCFENKSLCVLFQIPHMSYIIFIFLFLTYVAQYDDLQVHPCCCKWPCFMFLWLSNSPLSIRITSCLFIHLLMTVQVVSMSQLL